MKHPPLKVSNGKAFNHACEYHQRHDRYALDHACGLSKEAVREHGTSSGDGHPEKLADGAGHCPGGPEASMSKTISMHLSAFLFQHSSTQRSLFRLVETWS
jgi:hypothetical protein